MRCRGSVPCHHVATEECWSPRSSRTLVPLCADNIVRYGTKEKVSREKALDKIKFKNGIVSFANTLQKKYGNQNVNSVK